MPRYLIRFDCGPDETIDAANDNDARDYAIDVLVYHDAAPGEEAAIYRIDEGGRGEEEHIETITAGDPDD